MGYSFLFRLAHPSDLRILWDPFLSFWVGFEVVLAFFALPTPPTQCRVVVYVIGPLICGTGQSFFVLFSCSSCRSPPLRAGGHLGILAIPTVGQDCATSCVLFFGDLVSPRPPSLRWWRYFGFSRFRLHILAPHPLGDEVAVVFVDVLPVPYG